MATILSSTSVRFKIHGPAFPCPLAATRPSRPVDRLRMREYFLPHRFQYVQKYDCEVYEFNWELHQARNGCLCRCRKAADPLFHPSP